MPLFAHKCIDKCDFCGIIFRHEKEYDPLAQKVEHMTFNHGVRSSTLRWITKRNKSELFRKSKLVRICFFAMSIILKQNTAESDPPVTLGDISNMYHYYLLFSIAIV